MRGLRITSRGKNLVALLLVAASLAFMAWAFNEGERTRCTYLVEQGRPAWMIERECPDSYSTQGR